MKKIDNFKIIASFASWVDKVRKDKVFASSKLIEKVVYSSIYYDGDIDYQSILNCSEKISKVSSFFKRKKMIIVEVGEYNTLNYRVLVNTDNIKIVEIGLFSFLSKLSTDFITVESLKFDMSNILSNISEKRKISYDKLLSRFN